MKKSIVAVAVLALSSVALAEPGLSKSTLDLARCITQDSKTECEKKRVNLENKAMLQFSFSVKAKNKLIVAGTAVTAETIPAVIAVQQEAPYVSQIDIDKDGKKKETTSKVKSGFFMSLDDARIAEGGEVLVSVVADNSQLMAIATLDSGLQMPALNTHHVRQQIALKPGVPVQIQMPMTCASVATEKKCEKLKEDALVITLTVEKL